MCKLQSCENQAVDDVESSDEVETDGDDNEMKNGNDLT